MANASYQSSVSNFLTKVNQGVKPNLFEVEFAFPTGVTAPTSGLASYMCKAGALPASNIGVIEVPFRGRTIKIAGDRTFDTWTATFINDSGFSVRQSMEQWMQLINKHEANTGDLYVPSSSGSTGYTKDLIVRQLERDSAGPNSVIRVYKLVGAFPTNVSQIDLAYDSNDQIEDFTVEFQYQYWTVESGGTAAGTIS
jgi:hypothetical protein